MTSRQQARVSRKPARASSRQAPGPVLLLTHSGDYFTVDRVAQALDRRRVRWRRVDTDTFPSRLKLEVRLGAKAPRVTLDDGGVVVDLTRVPAAWVRRLWPGVAEPGTDVAAARACLVGALEVLPRTRFVNPLAAEARAESKLLQLEFARQAGLATVPTLATNSAAPLGRAGRRQALVTKLLEPAAVSMGAAPGFVYTHPPTPDDLTGLTLRPQLFQPWVRKVRDWRVVLVGRRTFAASLDARRSRTGNVDWRLVQPEDGLAWREERLPGEVERKARALLRRLGLVYGAFDFLEVAGRRLVFLEVNPAGEYGWLERDLGLPISDAIAETLSPDSR